MSKLCIVTGANKGLGFECVRQLREVLPADYDVLLTSRNVELGHAAVAKLADASLEVLYHQCDIADEDSVSNLRDHVQEKYGGVDILINNAGFAYQGASAEVPFSKQAADTVAINFDGTLRMMHALVPLLRPHARVVNVASMAGQSALHGLSDDLAARITSRAAGSAGASQGGIEAFMRQFVTDCAAGDNVAKGWPLNSYGMSKLGIMALTRLFAEEEALAALGCADTTGVLVNCCCPGWCHSDMSATIAKNNDNSFQKSTADGADTINWLALLPPTTGSGRSMSELPRGKFAMPHQFITDRGMVGDEWKAALPRWAEWTFWSGANGGEYYMAVEREAAAKARAGGGGGGAVVEMKKDPSHADSKSRL